MSWVEEQDWFGLEDQALETLYGSDYDIDSETLDEGIEFIAIPAWRMKDGELIAIKDIDTSHIKNCIKMIYKSNGTGDINISDTLKLNLEGGSIFLNYRK